MRFNSAVIYRRYECPQVIAAGLGMTRAQAIGVITMAEQGAQQG
jgi:hypothetical protein